MASLKNFQFLTPMVGFYRSRLYFVGRTLLRKRRRAHTMQRGFVLQANEPSLRLGSWLGNMVTQKLFIFWVGRFKVFRLSCTLLLGIGSLCHIIGKT